jgi:hypothetical protein
MLGNRFMWLVLNVVYLRALWVNLVKEACATKPNSPCGVSGRSVGPETGRTGVDRGQPDVRASRLCTVVVLGACVA